MRILLQNSPRYIILTVIIASILLMFMAMYTSRLHIQEKSVVVQSIKDTDKLIPSNQDSMEIDLPDATQVKSMSMKQLLTVYHNYINRTQILCNNIVRMGNKKDGGWEICNDENYRPPSPCLVYSFGINNDFSFDDMIANRLGCTVHSFDPSMKQKSYNRSQKVTFHNKGLADYDGKNGGWEMRRFSTIMKELGHKKVDVIKIDIEIWEWNALPDMLSSVDLKIGTQLLVEFHVINRQRKPLREKYEIGLPLLKALYQKGFRIFLTRKNHACWMKPEWDKKQTMYGCQEVIMIKIK